MVKTEYNTTLCRSLPSYACGWKQVKAESPKDKTFMMLCSGNAHIQQKKINCAEMILPPIRHNKEELEELRGSNMTC